MYVLKVENGTVLLESDSNQYSLTAEEILSVKFLQSTIQGTTLDKIKVSEEFSRLKIRRKPIRISYKPNTDSGELKIEPTIKELPLSEPQLTSIIEHGYFIDETNKLFTVLNEDIEKLTSTFKEETLAGKLQKIAELKSEGDLSGTTENIVDSLLVDKNSFLEVEESKTFRHKLYPYQRYGVHWLLHCYINNLGTILGDDMGLGKTAQIIALIAESFNKNIIERAMIIVPNSLLENWRREFEFFCPSIVPYLHYGNKRTGLAEVLSPYKVVIMPYTVMSTDIEMLVSVDVSLLVFDEASLLKNPDSARSMAASRINAHSKITMTGTPVENNLLDIWSLSNIVCPGYLGTKEDFMGQYVERDIQSTLDNDLSGLENNISQIMIRRMKEDILDDLPEKIDIHQPVIMPIQERTEYDQITSEIRNADIGGGANVLMEITKMQKFTSHPVLTDEAPSAHNLKQLLKRSAKLERLFELLEEISARREKVLIFANHHSAIDLLKSSIKEKFGITALNIDGRIDTIERQNTIDIFLAIEGFAVLVLNPKTAGMGLNITSANHVIHYSRQWNPALEEQATARAFRNGQTKDVNAYYLFYVDTIEEVIDQRLRLKKELANNVISVVDNKNNEIEFYLENI
jgi:SNF2 family DNA or RNA helicase